MNTADETTPETPKAREQGGVDLPTYAGRCHCGAVRFEVRADLRTGVSRCNCSICVRIAKTGVLVKPQAFTLLEGEESLSTYAWGAKIGQNRFCRTCGVHCFSTGSLEVLGGDFVSVNLNAVEGIEVQRMKVVYWDGRHDNWMAGPRDTPWPITSTGAGETAGAETVLAQN